MYAWWAHTSVLEYWCMTAALIALHQPFDGFSCPNFPIVLFVRKPFFTSRDPKGSIGQRRSQDSNSLFVCTESFSGLCRPICGFDPFFFTSTQFKKRRKCQWHLWFHHCQFLEALHFFLFGKYFSMVLRQNSIPIDEFFMLPLFFKTAKLTETWMWRVTSTCLPCQKSVL